MLGKVWPHSVETINRDIFDAYTIHVHLGYHCVVYSCRQLDRDNLGVVKRYQFKDLLEARFKVKVSDEELASVVRPLMEDTNLSLIPYARFLELFSSPR